MQLIDNLNITRVAANKTLQCNSSSKKTQVQNVLNQASSKATKSNGGINNKMMRYKMVELIFTRIEENANPIEREVGMDVSQDNLAG